MGLQFWFILLGISSIQCLLLIWVVLRKKAGNTKASGLLLTLLVIIFCTLCSNAWTSAGLYRLSPVPSLIARGMVLLLGPVIYLYTLASIYADYRFRPAYLIHFLPYLFILGFNSISSFGLTDTEMLDQIHTLVAGKAVIDTLWFAQFTLYMLHLVAYLLLIRFEIRKTMQQQGKNYIITLTQRSRWLKIITSLLLLVMFAFAGILVYILVTGTYTIEGNIVYTLTLSVMIYVISYQAMNDHRLLVPGFEEKYRSARLDEHKKNATLERIIQLFEQEDIFINPDLTIKQLALQTGIPPHTLSQLINENLGKTFSELVNHYRVEAFKKKAADPAFRQFSVMGLAQEVGYRTKSVFHNAFRNHTGQTPSEYLKSIG